MKSISSELKYCFLVFCFLVSIPSKCYSLNNKYDKNEHIEKIGIHLLKDTNFRKGFIQHGSKITKDTIDILRTSSNELPDWHLGQWYSNFALMASNLHNLNNGEYSITNNANSIILNRDSVGESIVTLIASGKLEWNDEIRKQGDAWPHLLISQDIDCCPTLDKLGKLKFAIETRVNRWEIFQKNLYDPKIHAMRFRLNFVVKNINKASQGYRNYYWFVMTFFDNRHSFMPPISIKDKGSDNKQASNKFIYSPDAKEYLPRSLHELEWVRIDKDILPLVKNGITQAKLNGYILNTDQLQDYSVTGFNFGFEITGVIDIESQIRHLDAIAYTKD